MTILVTGDNGMIGSQLIKGLLESGYKVIGVDLSGEETCSENYCHYKCNLADKDKLNEIADANNVDRFIHLAALAHTTKEMDATWERYKQINVDCAKNVFAVAGQRPVLFISTVDVFGFYDGKSSLNGESPTVPVSNYGKSKLLAEIECKKLSHYTIFRFSPVYSNVIMRDIQKRYYLKYPKVAYQIGKGTHFEILNIERAVDAMVNWCSEIPQNRIRIIKDEKMMWTPDYIEAEKEKGNAKVVLHFPKWIVEFGYKVLRFILGDNEKIYLINKAVHPLRTE